ncbi:MAG: hypothetical protein ACOC0M_00335 [Halomonas sp.]
MANHPVKWFSSDMGGHPTLGGTAAGDFNALLKACLISGFNQQPAASLEYDSQENTVTATLSTGHGFLKHQVVAITGADQAEYNGEFRVIATGDTWITYTPDTAPSTTPATGSLLEATAAPVGGWEVVMEDATNHHLALRSTAPDASPHTFMITNDGYEGAYSYQEGNYARMRILESFTDFSTFEMATDQWWPASHRHTGEEWLLVADDKTIYWVNRYAYQGHRSVFVLGDIETVRPGDASHCLTIGIENNGGAEWDSSDSPYSDFLNLGSTAYRTIARAHHQLPGSTSWSLEGIGGTIGGLFSYPNPQTNGFYVATGKLMVKESGGLRGFMPGVLQPLQTSGVYHQAILDNLPDLEGVPVLFWLATDSRSYNSDDHLIAFRLDQWREEVGA